MKTTIPAARHEPQYQNRQTDTEATDELARTIAEEFDDLKHLATYQAYCRRYPESVIRRAHDETMSVPPEKLKRSRLALFIFLVKKHADSAE